MGRDGSTSTIGAHMTNSSGSRASAISGAAMAAPAAAHPEISWLDIAVGP